MPVPHQSLSISSINFTRRGSASKQFICKLSISNLQRNAALRYASKSSKHRLPKRTRSGLGVWSFVCGNETNMALQGLSKPVRIPKNRFVLLKKLPSILEIQSDAIYIYTGALNTSPNNESIFFKVI